MAQPPSLQPLERFTEQFSARGRDWHQGHRFIEERLRFETCFGRENTAHGHLPPQDAAYRNRDLRAGEILDAVYHLLQELAARIEDQELRRSYLENVPAHREVVAAWDETSHL